MMVSAEPHVCRTARDTDPRAEALGLLAISECGLGRRLHQQVVDHALVW